MGLEDLEFMRKNNKLKLVDSKGIISSNNRLKGKLIVYGFWISNFLGMGVTVTTARSATYDSFWLDRFVPLKIYNKLMKNRKESQGIRKLRI